VEPRLNQRIAKGDAKEGQQKRLKPRLQLGRLISEQAVIGMIGRRVVELWRVPRFVRQSLQKSFKWREKCCCRTFRVPRIHPPKRGGGSIYACVHLPSPIPRATMRVVSDDAASPIPRHLNSRPNIDSTFSSCQEHVDPSIIPQ